MRNWINGALGGSSGTQDWKAGEQARERQWARKRNAYLVIPGPAQNRRSHDPEFLTTCMTEIDPRPSGPRRPG